MKVLALLRNDILTGILKPGQQIIQDTLATRYNVSRVPLREAMKILEGEGQVVHHPHRGYFVAELDPTDLQEVYTLRDLLEREAIYAAIPLMTDSDIHQVAVFADEVNLAAASGDLLAITLANRRFHFAIFECSRMPRLVRLLTQLWDASDVYRSVYFAAEGRMHQIAKEHDVIIRALRVRDTESVCQGQSNHRRNALTSLTALMSASDQVGVLENL